jgi:hypothetical protein
MLASRLLKSKTVGALFGLVPNSGPHRQVNALPRGPTFGSLDQE